MPEDTKPTVEEESESEYTESSEESEGCYFFILYSFFIYFSFL